MPKENPNLKENIKIDTHEPERYNVIFHNDDFTPMDFVVMILMDIFMLDFQKAEQVMLSVHNNGTGSVGTYSYDIAVSKASKATSIARKEGFPLRLSVQPA